MSHATKQRTSQEPPPVYLADDEWGALLGAPSLTDEELRQAWLQRKKDQEQ